MNWRRLLLLAAFVAVMILIISNLGQLDQFLHLLKQLRWYLLSLVFIIQAISYYANAKYYQSVLAIFDYQVPFYILYELALSVNFVNQVFPTGGVSGASHLSSQLMGRVPVGKTTLIQLLRYIFTYLSFLVVLVAGFLMLFLGGNVNRITVRIILLMIVVILVGSGVMLVLIRDRSRVEKIAQSGVRGIYRVLNWFSRKKKRQLNEQKLKQFFDDFYHGYEILLANPRRWRRPLQYTLLGNLAEVGTVYAVFIAFNHWVNFGAVVVAYLVANIVSLVSVFAGGVGFYEAAMVATLVALGLPLTISLSAVLVYRVLNFWLFLPFGFYFYRKRLWTNK